MIKALLIDDEAFIREDIREKLTTYFSKEIIIVGEAHSVTSGLEAIQNYEPNLLFLDIKLDDGTGFDLIQQSANKNFEVIFITAYSDKAIKAIKVGALDYLLKPVADDEFQEAVQKMLHKKNKEGQHLEKLIEISSEYFKGVKNKRVILKTLDTVYAVYEDDIVFCQSDGNYTTFHTVQAEKIIVSKSMKKIEEILSEDIFVRCHQSYIVNKKHVLKYNKEGVLIVQNDEQVPVSSRRKDYTLKRIFD